MTARLAMLAHTVASVRRESRVWVRNLVGEGHAAVRRNRQAGEKELAAEGMKRTVGVALFLALTFTLARPGFTQTTIPAPGVLPSGLAYDGTFLYVSEASGFRTIYKLDPTASTTVISP